MDCEIMSYELKMLFGAIWVFSWGVLDERNLLARDG
jgi:hypothetical protein